MTHEQAGLRGPRVCCPLKLEQQCLPCLPFVQSPPAYSPSASVAFRLCRLGNTDTTKKVL